MMDRRTLLAFALIAVVLILTPWYMNIVAPTKDPSPAPAAGVSSAPDNAGINNFSSLSPPEIKKGTQKEKSQKIKITTALYIASLDNRGGGVFADFYLNEYTRFDSAQVNIIDEQSSDHLIVSFVSLDGDEVVLDNNWSLVTPTTNVLLEGGQTDVTFETSYGSNRIRKTFTFYSNSYSIGLSLFFESPDEYISRGQYTISWSGGVAPSEKNTKDEHTYFKGYAYLGDELLEPSAPEGRLETERQTGTTQWTAVKSKYFTAAIIPETPGVGAEVSGTTSKGRPIYNTALRQGVSSSNYFNLYIGPLDYSRVEALGVGLENIMNLGWSIFRPLGRLVTWSLKQMYGLVPNYGLVVIIFAIIVKILLNPLTKKQMVSTKKMQALQPQIQRLKEKHKNDPQKLNKAQMELFKETGVNPMGGCLPLFLQMPILISFFTVFRSTIEFRGAPFFGWISDLSLPDTLISIAGFPINILPFFMGATMFLQQKLMTPTAGGSQQKFMLYGMNAFFLILFYSFPSGLNLYYSVFNLLSIVQHKYFMPNFENPKTGPLPKNKK